MAEKQKEADAVVTKTATRVRFQNPFYGPDGELYPVRRSGCIVPAGVTLPKTAKVLGEVSMPDDNEFVAALDNSEAMAQMAEMAKTMTAMQAELDALKDKKEDATKKSELKL